MFGALGLVASVAGCRRSLIFLAWPYPARAQDDAPQEMEGKLATAELLARLDSAWLQFSFSPFPVGHPAYEHTSPVH